VIYQFSVFFSLKRWEYWKSIWASCWKIRPLVLNYPVTFVQGSARSSSALCLSFTFLLFLLFSEFFPFFIFYYFLQFKATSQLIMNINTPNWSLGLVEYIMYNDVIYIIVSHRMTSQMSKFSPMLQFKHYECVLDKQ